MTIAATNTTNDQVKLRFLARFAFANPPFGIRGLFTRKNPKTIDLSHRDPRLEGAQRDLERMWQHGHFWLDGR